MDSLHTAGATPAMTLCVLSEPDYPSFLLTPSVLRIVRPTTDFRVSQRDYLGHGGSGHVYKATEIATGKLYARKELHYCDQLADDSFPSGRVFFARETSETGRTTAHSFRFER
jgi:hypothetical protein